MPMAQVAAVERQAADPVANH
jgi:hypothetical protein